MKTICLALAVSALLTGSAAAKHAERCEAAAVNRALQTPMPGAPPESQAPRTRRPSSACKVWHGCPTPSKYKATLTLHEGRCACTCTPIEAGPSA